MSKLVPINVNTTYAFNFDTPLDKFSGIYTVNAILNYSELMDASVDLLADTFAPVGMPLEQYNSILPKLRKSNTYKLISPENKDLVIYIPELYVTQVPNHNVKKYYEIVLAVNIDILDDTPKLASVVSSTIDNVQATLGITTKPKIFELRGIWLTKEQYQEILAGREANANLSTNYFTESVRLRKEVDALRSKLAAYEDIIIKASAT